MSRVLPLLSALTLARLLITFSPGGDRVMVEVENKIMILMVVIEYLVAVKV